MPMNLDRAFGIHPLALSLRARRAELLATNLAHSDTPGYKARDLDFLAALAQALDGRGGPMVLRTTHPAHIAAAVEPSDFTGLQRYRVPSQPALDGNTVEAQREHIEFMDNAVRYQASLAFVNARLRTLLTAIRGE